MDQLYYWSLVSTLKFAKGQIGFLYCWSEFSESQDLRCQILKVYTAIHNSVLKSDKFALMFCDKAEDRDPKKMAISCVFIFMIESQSLYKIVL